MAGIDLSNIYGDLERIASDPLSKMANDAAGKAGDAVGTKVAKAMGRWKYAQNLVEAPPVPDIPSIIQKIETQTIQTIQKDAVEYIANELGDLLAPPNPGDIISKGAAIMSQYVKKPGDILKEASTSSEKIAEEIEEKNLKENTNKITEDTNKAVSDAKENTNKSLDEAKKWLSKLPEYIFMGPEYIEQAVNTVNKNISETIKKNVGQRFDKAKKVKSDFVENLSTNYAKKKAEKINQAQYKVGFDNIKKVNEAKQKALAKAKASAKETLMDMKAKLGL